MVKRHPSEKQRLYAQAIAGVLRIDLPKSFSMEAFRKFIMLHKGEYLSKKSETDTRPPTEKQTSFAESIAKSLNIRLPKCKSVTSYSKFISEHIDAYRDLRNSLPWEDTCSVCPDDGKGNFCC